MLADELTVSVSAFSAVDFNAVMKSLRTPAFCKVPVIRIHMTHTYISSGPLSTCLTFFGRG